MSEGIGLKSINELRNFNFYIPSYQRGYRWTEQQVKDLLDDVWEFMQKKGDSGAFYCLQPLVVKESITNRDEYLKEIRTIDNDDLLTKTKDIVKKYTRWEVIDGQQRLTTIYIIFSCLGELKLYSLDYETRKEYCGKKGSKDFLDNISNEENGNDNIDYFHMIQTREMVKKWLEGKTDEERTQLTTTFLNKVKFIWYETSESDPIKVFTRLNIGKIGLTNAELIKALFLNKSNFEDTNYNSIRLRQQEIASQWDKIECTLQNDEFWLFLHDKGYTNPTRIDFIFNLICEQNLLYLKCNDENASLNDTENSNDVIGTDEYRTFRYFYNYFYPKAEDSKKDSIKKSPDEKLSEAWDKVKTIFQIFEEWFNDLELYHYVGYLVACNKDKTLKDLYSNYIFDGNTKDSFKIYLKNEIKKSIDFKKKLCDEKDLNNSLHYDKDKGLIRKILLLHNVQSVINQNKGYENKKEYNLPVFYKFPFHLFKKEEWNVEHIDSDSTNDLSKLEQQKEWVASVYFFNKENLQDLRLDIKKFLSDEETKCDFESLLSNLRLKNKELNLLDDSSDNNQKMAIWNLALLDEATNKGYHNDIFPIKRRKIIGKEEGKITKIDYKAGGDKDIEMEFKDNSGAVAFIPPCTKNVFLKHYTSCPNNLTNWTKTDAGAYLKNIKDTLKDFLPNEDDENE